MEWQEAKPIACLKDLTTTAFLNMREVQVAPLKAVTTLHFSCFQGVQGRIDSSIIKIADVGFPCRAEASYVNIVVGRRRHVFLKQL